MTARETIALIAHDEKKDDMAEFARLATVYDIPMALNRATAEMLIAPDRD